MPQQILQEVNNTFVKGLITEAGPLTFPKDASVDELNMTLNKDGSRRRRLGVELETGATNSPEVVSSNTTISTFDWKNVGDDSLIEFLGVQIGTTLIFYQKGPTVSSGRVMETFTSSTEYSVDLTTFEKPNTLGSDSVPVSASSIDGELVVVSNEIEPFKIVRDPTTGSFTESLVPIRVRDFEWLGDKASYDLEVKVGDVTDARKYDTNNSGWSTPNITPAPLTTYTAATSLFFPGENSYPPLTHSWFSGKDSNGNFSVAEFRKVYTGTSILANGHYILDFFSKDRETASGIAGLDSTEDNRFTTVASFAGRVFYGGVGDKILFSQQLVDDTKEIGDCFQVNDPTSEIISDLLDTDGGSLRISEANNITKLHVFGASLLVFADNGVWRLSGVDDVFRATEFSITKISNIGLGFNGSFVAGTGGRPFWWSSTGIYTLTADEASGVFREQNISVGTIQTFYDAISREARDSCFAEYDSFNKTLFWFYPEDDETTSNKVNNILILDEELSAFHPWKISDQASNTNSVVGASFFDGVGSLNDVDYNVIDKLGNTVIDSNSDEVIVSLPGPSFASTGIKLLTRLAPSGELTFSGFSNAEFVDWESADYSSFAEAGYNFLGDIITLKDTPYVTVVFGVTETGWVSSGTSYELVRPSSCLVSHIWDFRTSFTSSQQGYRLKRIPVVDPLDLSTFNYPFSVVSTRLRLRGRGKNVRIRFESEAGKDFHLIGWETIGAKNAGY